MPVDNDIGGCLEFHDARIGRLLVSSDGRVEIEFKHICLYEAAEITEDMGPAWSAYARLVLADPTFIEVVGTVRADDYIAVGHLVDQGGGQFAVVNAASTSLARSCEFRLAGSGTTIKASFGRAVWTGITRLERID